MTTNNLDLSSPKAITDLSRLGFLEKDAWSNLSPNLHVDDNSALEGFETFLVDEATLEALQQKILTEGYIHIQSPEWNLPLEGMSQVITRIVEIGLAPVFAFVYDEFWLAFCKLHHILAGLLGDAYKRLPDFWIWRVDPVSGGSGWAPHRDKGRRSLQENGSPKSISVWLPLTSATPLNGCMYIVPADRDPTYNTEDEKRHVPALQDIRALPCSPGEIFMWNQAILHWGGRSSPEANSPRISVSIEFQRGEIEPFNTPLMEPLTLANFDFRMQLICKQVMQYGHMNEVSSVTSLFVESLCAKYNLR